MCGRFASQLPPELLRFAFAALGDIPNTPPSWNVAPTQAALVIRRHPEAGERRLDALRWGLVPHFTKDLRACKRPINARAETIAVSGMFRGALASRRCLVPDNAFYEWKPVADGKQPYAITRVEGSPLAFAGLWEGWRSHEGETLQTFTIATATANADMDGLHDRMPVILEPDAWPVWLREVAGDHATLRRPASAGTVRRWPVSRAVNSVRNNGVELLTPMVDDGPEKPQKSQLGMLPAYELSCVYWRWRWRWRWRPGPVTDRVAAPRARVSAPGLRRSPVRAEIINFDGASRGDDCRQSQTVSHLGL